MSRELERKREQKMKLTADSEIRIPNLMEFNSLKFL